jgi:hypothetical protein
VALIAAIATVGLVACQSAASPSQAPAAPVSAQAAAPSGPGRLVANETMIDLGGVPFDKMAEARFELTNTGTSPVALVGSPRVKMLEGC